MNASSRAVPASGSREPTALFRLMSENWPGVVLVLDRELRVRWVNAAASTLFARRHRTVIDLDWADLELPWAVGEEQLRTVASAGELRLEAAPCLDGEGVRRHYTARLVPLREVPNLITAILCIIEESPGDKLQTFGETQVGFWKWDFAAREFSVDARWCRSVNVDPLPGEDHFERWAQAIHPDDVSEFLRKRADLETGRVDRIEVEYRMLAADAQWLWVLQRGRVTEKHPDGSPARASGVCIEIDDRKRAEVALQENEARLATALWGARAAFWQWHIVTDTMNLSPLWFAITGYTREQWDSIPKPWTARLHPEDRDRVSQRIRQHLDGQNQSIEVEFRIRTANDDWKWMLMRGRVIEWDFDGRPTSAIGVSLDIDAQKRAEVELHSSEARLETAVWGAGMGLWELDFRSEWTRWFSDWCERLDLHACDGPDHVARWDSNIHPDDLGAAAQCFSDHVAGKEDYYDAEYRIRDRSGRWHWLFERGRVVERASDGTALRMVGVCMDIDARKGAELALMKSQRRMEVALESARGGMWERDMVTGESTLTDYVYRMLGLLPTESPGPDFWAQRVHPDDLPRLLESLRRTAAGESEVFEAEYRLRHADGSWRWVVDRGRAIDREPSGKATQLVGFIVEITDRVQTQEALRRSEFRYRTVASMTPGFVFEYRLEADGKYRPVWISDGLQAVFGCTMDEYVRLGGWHAFIDPDQSVSAESLAEPGEMPSGEVRVRTVDGQTKWLQASSVSLKEPGTGTIVGFIGAAHDITTRKVAEHALLGSEALLRAVTENSADWLAMFDCNGKCVFLNRKIRGVPPERWIGRNVSEFSVDADPTPGIEAFQHIIQTGEPRDFDLISNTAEYGERTLQVRARAVKSDGGILGMLANLTDVTDRNAQQNALRMQARILETMREGVVLFDDELRIQFTNETFDTMFGYRPEALLGQRIEPWLTLPPAQRKRMMQGSSPQNVAPGEVLPGEFECERRDGTHFVASCLITPLSVGGKQHWLAVLNDVTERKRLEREIIEIANREQQRIGSDLHDGLGQDLTGVALMLRGVAAQLKKECSAARLDVEDVISLVNNAIESTRALARGLSPVSAERGGLSAALRALAVRSGERYGIHVMFHDFVPEPLRLDETAATHLYRIAQEALTNVIRHSLATEVRIHLESTADELQLRIEDNGRGFVQYPAEGINGLGLKIMRYRAQMLGGDLALEAAAGGGALVRCTCPLIASKVIERPARSAYPSMPEP